MFVFCSKKLEQTNETTHIISISNNILMTLYNVITYLSNQNILGGIENIPSSLLVACWSSISGAYYCLAEGNIINNDNQNSWINSNQLLSSKSSIPLSGNHHFFEGIYIYLYSLNILFYFYLLDFNNHIILLILGYNIFRMASFELFSLLSHLKSNMSKYIYIYIFNFILFSFIINLILKWKIFFLSFILKKIFIESDSILKENENFITKFNNLEKAINQLKQEK